MCRTTNSTSYRIAPGEENNPREGRQARLLTEERNARVERLDLVRGAHEGHDLGRDGAGHPFPGVRLSPRQPPRRQRQGQRVPPPPRQRSRRRRRLRRHCRHRPMLARPMGEAGGDLYAIRERWGGSLRGWTRGAVRLPGRQGKRRIRIPAPAEEARNSALRSASRVTAQATNKRKGLFSLGGGQRTASLFSARSPSCGCHVGPVGPAVLESRKPG
jgi:hypothetical protein